MITPRTIPASEDGLLSTHHGSEVLTATNTWINRAPRAAARDACAGNRAGLGITRNLVGCPVGSPPD